MQNVPLQFNTATKAGLVATVHEDILPVVLTFPHPDSPSCRRRSHLRVRFLQQRERQTYSSPPRGGRTKKKLG